MGNYRVHGSNDTLKPMDNYLKVFFGWFELSCLSLSRHLNSIGVHKIPENWPRDSWYHKIDNIMHQIASTVPQSAKFILVDDNQLGLQNIVMKRLRLHLMERNRQYWGSPETDEIAIQEIERHKDSGAAYLFFAWTSFWWLNHYHDMHNYLHSNYQMVMNNDLLIGFNLMQNISISDLASKRNSNTLLKNLKKY
jgi:hypothetical protein